MYDGFEIGLGTHVFGRISKHHPSQCTSIDVACLNHTVAESFPNSFPNLWTFQHSMAYGISIHDNEIFSLGKSLCEKTFTGSDSSYDTNDRN